MKKFFLMILGVAVFIAAVGYFVGPPGSSGDSPLTRFVQNLAKKETMKVSGHDLSVEIAKTQEERSRGLSGRNSLAAGTGMLFVFENIGKPTFWMKDMSFPIDIIWINEAGKIVGVNKNVQPEPGVSDNSLTRYNPDEETKYVLETKAGYFDANGISVGDSIELPKSVQ